MEEKLESVAEHLFKKSSQDVYSDKGTAIQRSVERLVTKLVNAVGDIDNRYKVSEILKVGGFYEGTKVEKPDEFDYLVIIDELSRPGAVFVERNGPMHATVKINDNVLQSRWTEFLHDGCLRCFSVGYAKWGKGTTFGERMISVIKNLLDEESIAFSLDEMIEVKYIGNNALHEFIDDVNLNLVRVVAREPNILLCMEYNGLYLSADISPAIRVCGLEKDVEQKELIHDQLYERIYSVRSLLLVNSRENLNGVLFKVTFTEIEFSLVQSLSPKRKTVYRYLKLLHHLCRKKRPDIEYRSKVTSYILKTACVYQDMVIGHANCNIIEFIYAVLSYLYEGIHNKFLPSLFSRKHNLFKYKIFGYTKDLVATSKMEILLLAQVTQALLTADDHQELDDKMIFSLISKFCRNSGCVGYQVAHTCTHIKFLDSDLPIGSRLSSRRIVRFNPKLQIKAKLRNKIIHKKISHRRMICLGPYHHKTLMKKEQSLKRLGGKKPMSVV